MNSEELEVSLRSEFETYLKNVLAEMRQEISQIQEKVTTELERHKSQLDEAFQMAVGNFEKEHEFDVSFKESVVEHLRLARDEGAQITAMAIARAEEMEKDKAPAAGVKEIFEAVNEISAKSSQSEILKTLVQHAAHFAPRGAFFIVKNEHLVGWRVFGKEKGEADEKVREVFLSTNSESVLGKAVKSLSTVSDENGGLASDVEILQKLEFGEPQKMVAIPLVARGRGVAVLYADHGNEGADVNTEALETLVRVAGLTVEVLASNKTAATSKRPAGKKTEETFSANEYSTGENSVSSPDVLSGYQTGAAVSPMVARTEKFFENASPVAEDQYSATLQESGEEAAGKPETGGYDSNFAENNQFDYAENQNENQFDYTDNAEKTSFDYTTTQYRDNSQDEAVTQIEEPSTNEFADYYTKTPSDTDFSNSSTETADKVENETPSTATEYGNFQYSQTEEPTPIEKPADFTSDSWATPVSEFEKVQQEAPQTSDLQDDPINDYISDYSYQSSKEEKYPAFETNPSWSSATQETTEFSAQEFAENFAKETDPVEYAKDFSYQAETQSQENDPVKDYSFESQATETQAPAQAEEISQTEEFVPTKEQTFEVENGKAPVQTAPKSRLSERNVDLPIEVGEDERRLHNDARRFARLLVSEIKLYNEQKVKEGRDGNDLYERLREAIDRSREMYDKRVQPPVAAKFDYFHYELVNTLAEGDDNKLGAGYPGSTV